MARKKTNEVVTYAETQLEVAKALEEVKNIPVQNQTEAQLSSIEEEQLIAEAYKLTGRVEGLQFIQKVAVTSSLMMLRKIKEEKIYKKMPGIGTWENYCKSIKYSRRYIDEQLENLETFGMEFLEVTSTFGINDKSLRKLRKAKADSTLSVGEKTITIEIEDGKQEVIPFADPDELKDALESLIEAKEVQLKSMRQMQEFSDKRYTQTEKELRKAQKKINDIEKAGEINGMPVDDYKHFNELSVINEGITNIYASLTRISNESLSDNIIKYLHGSIMYMVHLAGELSDQVPSYAELDILDKDLFNPEKLHLAGVNNLAGHQEDN